MTDPLFVADLDTLKLKVRMKGVPDSNTEALAILDECILQARIQFYRRLGSERVAQLVALPFNMNPTTDDEILRALANTVEVRLVVCCLAQALPHAFLDASGSLCSRWNEEAPLRETPATQREDYLEHCINQIEEDMQLLAAEEEIGDEVDIQVFDGTPECPAPQVGKSLTPWSSRLHNRHNL